MAGLGPQLVRLAPEALQRTARFAIEVQEKPWKESRQARVPSLDEPDEVREVRDTLLDTAIVERGVLASRSFSDEHTALCSPAVTLHPGAVACVRAGQWSLVRPSGFCSALAGAVWKQADASPAAASETAEPPSVSQHRSPLGTALSPIARQPLLR
jgi:hypothetical protein